MAPQDPQKPNTFSAEDAGDCPSLRESRAATVSRLFREHNRTLLGFLFTRLKNEQDAKEVAQEAYVKVLALEQKPGAANFMRSYLFRVAENLAVDRVRQRLTRARLDPLRWADEIFEDDVTEREAAAAQELKLLKQLIAELPEKCGEAFRLRKIEDCGVQEVAQRLGVTERMVCKHVTKALVYIRLRREGAGAAEAWAEVRG